MGRRKLTDEEKELRRLQKREQHKETDKREVKEEVLEKKSLDIEAILAKRDDAFREQNAVPTHVIKPVEGTNQFVVEVINAKNYAIEDTPPSNKEGWVDADYDHLVRTMPSNA